MDQTTKLLVDALEAAAKALGVGRTSSTLCSPQVASDIIHALEVACGNPVRKLDDAIILDQTDGHWMKLAVIILYKLNGGTMCRVMAEDIQRLEHEFAAGGGAAMFTHGHANAIDFQVVTLDKATQLAEYEKTQRGRG